MKLYSNCCRAFSSIETMLAIIVSMPALIGGVAILHLALTPAITARKARIDIQRHARLQAIVGSVIEDLQGHSFNILPRIHSSGQIVYTDGSASSVMNASPLQKPLANSDAISSLGLAINQTHMVMQNTFNATTATIYACPRFQLANQAFTATNYYGFLAITASHLIETYGTVSSPSGPKNCRTFILHQSLSNVLPPAPNNQLEFIAALVPISRNATWYVSERNILRYLSLRDGSVIENQPIQDQVPAVHFMIDYPIAPTIPSVSANYSLPVADLVTIRATPALARANTLQFILARP